MLHKRLTTIINNTFSIVRIYIGEANLTQHTTSISTENGTATIDAKVFTGYTKESYGLLEQISELNKDFKELVETIADTTKLDKKIVGKYLKARHKQATKEAKALGDVFDVLDGILA